MITVRLVAVPGSNEALLKGVSARPDLVLQHQKDLLSNDDDRPFLRLGRNRTTKISDPRVPQNGGKIYIDDSKRVQFRIKEASERVRVDGQRVLGNSLELHHGCRIALHGSQYQYRVEIYREEATARRTPATAAATASLDTNNTEGGTPSRFLQSMAEEVMCPLCMDVIVNAITLVPCGHVYCKACCCSRRNRVAECPTCRQRIKQTIPAKNYDNVIWNMVQEQAATPSNAFFSHDDVQSYLKRSKRRLDISGVSSRQQQPTSGISPARKRARVVSHSQPPPTLSPQTRSQAIWNDNTGEGNTRETAICID